MSTQSIDPAGNSRIASALGLSGERHRFASGALFALLGLAFAAVAQTASAAIPSSERQVLINIYTSTHGASWTTSTGWNGAAGTECGWFGITCDGTQSHVTKISLYNNGLTGSLPALTGLTSLEYFGVNSNQLTGNIPDLTGLTSLGYFHAYANQLTGPIPALTGLTSLEDFEVNSNQLTGNIPDLTGLTNLDSFYVSNNQLTGNIPDMTGLTSLGEFDVHANQLTGSIPAFTGLTRLYYFNSGTNHLTGSIPDLTGLTNLDSFYVSNNQLTGNIPDMTGLTSLGEFDVHANQLSGTLPAAPSSLSGASLCPNLLVPGLYDAAWNTATGDTPWWATPYANNQCDDIFTDGLDSQGTSD